ncbi:MAG: aspartate ammonia-lyase [Gammaproteobacteria bacterium]|nr:aspartate ammonia-lyase [Gammaproteobacteria bacterium]
MATNYKLASVCALISLLASATVTAQHGATRIERDLLGEKELPANAYYGIQTARAMENFQISGRKLAEYPEFVNAWALVKMAAAMANTDVGKMEPATRDAIVLAGNAILDGKYHEQFSVDPYQGGAGTSTNMNVNEVMANIALELGGHELGQYQKIEPHDHLNMSQSTNDTYPTALKVAIRRKNEALTAEAEMLADAIDAKASEFLEVLKIGRTEMQDAVPMTVGQEFHAFAAALRSEISFMRDAGKPLRFSGMGATAIGTGINAPDGYAEKVVEHLSALTGYEFVMADDLFAATWDQHAFVAASAALRGIAIKLSKIAGDLILLSSGPRAGLGDINLPAMQPGSSIMPGKVNPVIPELVNLVAFRVIANDVAVTLAAQNGQLQLNAYEPLVMLAILESQTLLTNTMRTFRVRCIDGISVNEDTLQRHIEQTVGIVTALNPIIGYDRATELAAEAYRTDKGILEIVRERQILTEQQIREILDPLELTGLEPEKY